MAKDKDKDEKSTFVKFITGSWKPRVLNGPWKYAILLLFLFGVILVCIGIYGLSLLATNSNCDCNQKGATNVVYWKHHTTAPLAVPATSAPATAAP